MGGWVTVRAGERKYWIVVDGVTDKNPKFRHDRFFKNYFKTSLERRQMFLFHRAENND